MIALILLGRTFERNDEIQVQGFGRHRETARIDG